AVGGLSFGTIRGQALNWKGSEPFISLAVGALATVLFPVLMVRRRHPLVPPSLFRSRNFTITNISTFVIYGALYVTITFQSLFLIGALGYTPSGAAVATIPSTLLLVLFSTRFGKLAARYGPRLFMTVGPAMMGLGLLWLVRVPATSHPWDFRLCLCRDLAPPRDYFIDFLPSLVVFGSGLMIMVAPLTTALMTSIPRHNAGVGSAINNAISRVGAPLVTALIFVAVVRSFYGAIAHQVPSVDTTSAHFRSVVAPLNPPEQGVSPTVVRAARKASTDSFHLAMLVSVALMAMGAGVNGLGIRNPKLETEAPPTMAEAAGEPPPGPGEPAPTAVATTGVDHEHVGDDDCLVCSQSQAPVVVRPARRKTVSSSKHTGTKPDRGRGSGAAGRSGAKPT
ncbi:MAG TPA: MFS transporter, partial [Actinomycetota bacterium]